MNGTERERSLLFDLQVRAGEIVRWRYQAMRLVLGKGLTYTPDFWISETDGTITLEETKGTAGWKLDSESRTKFLAAVEAFSEFRFRSAIKRTKKAGGGWDVQEHQPRLPSP